MNQKELKELIDFLIEKDITEFELERGDVKVKIKRGESHAAQVIMQAPPMMMSAAHAPAPAAPAAAPAHIPASSGPTTTPGAEPEQDKDLYVVKSPIVGTFYEAPSPGSPPFVKPGDHVDTGQVICIIEAMKLMNEIESDVSGEIVKRYANNGQPVEYGQALFAIRQQK
jgi:acetyl-CoA carboxylase biotin carboxyl carrier protein